MDYDKQKVDEMTLALLYLVTTKSKYEYRAWKGFDWDTMDRLFEKGYISDPKGKAKSVALTSEGADLSADLFKKHFTKMSSQ
jgi:hypothetical protein